MILIDRFFQQIVRPLAGRKFATVSLLLLLSASLTGCSMMPHALQPQQLWKLNRGEALGRDSYNFSIPDPEPHQDNNQKMLEGDPFQ